MVESTLTTEQGWRYRFESKSGADLKKDELTKCVQILAHGGAVDPKSASFELPLAYDCVLVKAGSLIVGLGAIKRQRLQYAKRISLSSGYLIAPSALELGYVAIDKIHRGKGLSLRIVATLLAAAPTRLFATTDSAAMKTVLLRAQFQECGRPWNGRRGMLSLLVSDDLVRVLPTQK